MAAHKQMNEDIYEAFDAPHLFKHYDKSSLLDFCFHLHLLAKKG